MIRVTVPRPVAEALMPRPCPHVDCEGEGDTHCWGCHGSGSLPPALNLLVVEGYWPPGFVTDDDHPPTPHPEHVRAIEAGERVGIDVECERCEGHGCLAGNETEQPDGRWFKGGASPHPTASDVWVVDCPHCTDGRVPVGSVLPTEVIPVYGPDTCPGPPSSGAPKHICIGPFLTDGEEPYPGMMAMHVTHLHDIAPDLTEVLSVYGPAESLVGKFAVEVEDARREP